MEEKMQTDPLAPQEVQQPEPSIVPQTKIIPPKPKRNLTVIFLVMCLVFLCMSVAGLGFWIYKLNTSLVSTQQQLKTLQSEYAELKSGNEKLTADLNQVKTDLEKANGDLDTAQTDLQRLQDRNEGVQSRIDQVSKKIEVLYVFSTTETVEDFLAIDALVKETNDKQLIGQWHSFVAKPSIESSTKFLLFLIGSIREDLKVIGDFATSISASLISM